MNTKVNVSDIFSRDEIKMLTQASDLSGAYSVASVWGVILMTFGGVALSWNYLPIWGKVLICMIALVILAGRQLALAILMHDAAHHSLFKTKWCNMYLTDWLCARPIWQNVKLYRPYHLRHHAKTSQPDDPDLSLVKNFPISQNSFVRKVVRDLTGQSGLKFLFGRVLMDLELLEWSVANDPKPIPRANRTVVELGQNLLKNSSGMLLSNAVLYAVLRATGHAKLYWLWPMAYITPFPLFIRIRAMAEHAGLQSSKNTLENTRTTQAGWLARSLVAPIHVNYHMEHHLMASVPHQHLEKMHCMLRERELVPKPQGYMAVIKQLIKPQQ
jgi:fatty acid desaturase